MSLGLLLRQKEKSKFPKYQKAKQRFQNGLPPPSRKTHKVGQSTKPTWLQLIKAILSEKGTRQELSCCL